MAKYYTALDNDLSTLTKEDIQKMEPQQMAKLTDEQIESLGEKQLKTISKEQLGAIIYRLKPQQFAFLQKEAVEGNLNKVKKIEKASYEVLVNNKKLSKTSQIVIKAHRITHKKSIAKGIADKLDSKIEKNNKQSKEIEKREKWINKTMKKEGITREEAMYAYDVEHRKNKGIKIYSSKDAYIKLPKKLKSRQRKKNGPENELK